MLTIRPKRPGFTIVEVLVVIGIIGLLMAVLLPALAGVWKTGQMTKSTNSLKQISEYMRLYSSSNREFIIPSQFDYSAAAAAGYPVKVRSAANPALGEQYKGTWTDIIWTEFDLFRLPEVVTEGGPPLPTAAYRYDSPDRNLYENSGLGSFDELQNPLRSPVTNQRAVQGGTGPKPFGTGAEETSLPGFFAANNFFAVTDAVAVGNGWTTNGQIKAPDRSMYLVDSFAGETIDPVPGPYQIVKQNPGDPDTLEVDFRYGDQCLMLFLDGHISPQGPWTDLQSLEERRQIRVVNPTGN